MAAETLCKNHICQGFLENPYLVPARWGANADKFIGEANATVTAVSCSENTEWVNSTDGSIWWEDCACNCGAATRVPLLGLVGIMVFYVVVVFLFVTGIKILRDGPTKEYENLKAAGKVTEDTEEIGGEAARAWMTKSEDEIRTDVRNSLRNDTPPLHKRPRFLTLAATCHHADRVAALVCSAVLMLPSTCSTADSARCFGSSRVARLVWC